MGRERGGVSLAEHFVCIYSWLALLFTNNSLLNLLNVGLNNSRKKYT